MRVLALSGCSEGSSPEHGALRIPSTEDLPQLLCTAVGPVDNGTAEAAFWRHTADPVALVPVQ